MKIEIEKLIAELELQKSKSKTPNFGRPHIRFSTI